MEIVFDENKRKANVEKHGFDFAHLDLEYFENGLVLQAHSGRFKAIGRFRDGTICVIFAALGTQAISLISMRAASLSERTLYEQYAKT
jgi:uncharacterized protein